MEKNKKKAAFVFLSFASVFVEQELGIVSHYYILFSHVPLTTLRYLKTTNYISLSLAFGTCRKALSAHVSTDRIISFVFNW